MGVGSGDLHCFVARGSRRRRVEIDLGSYGQMLDEHLAHRFAGLSSKELPKRRGLRRAA